MNVLLRSNVFYFVYTDLCFNLPYYKLPFHMKYRSSAISFTQKGKHILSCFMLFLYSTQLAQRKTVIITEGSITLHHFRIVQ
jgi:hypothetical protein